MDDRNILIVEHASGKAFSALAFPLLFLLISSIPIFFSDQSYDDYLHRVFSSAGLQTKYATFLFLGAVGIFLWALKIAPLAMKSLCIRKSIEINSDNILFVNGKEITKLHIDDKVCVRVSFLQNSLILQRVNFEIYCGDLTYFKDFPDIIVNKINKYIDSIPISEKPYKI